MFFPQPIPPTGFPTCTSQSSPVIPRDRPSGAGSPPRKSPNSSRCTPTLGSSRPTTRRPGRGRRPRRTRYRRQSLTRYSFGRRSATASRSPTVSSTISFSVRATLRRSRTLQNRLAFAHGSTIRIGKKQQQNIPVSSPHSFPFLLRTIVVTRSGHSSVKAFWRQHSQR